MDNWISADELPEGIEELLDRVLVICDTGLYAIGYKREGEWLRDSDGNSFRSFGYKVTNYQFLPQPPDKHQHTQQEKDNWDKEMDN